MALALYKDHHILGIILCIILFTACAPIRETVKPAVVTSTTIPAYSPSDAKLIIATETSIPLSPNQIVEDLIKIIQASDPESPDYDPESIAFAEFPNVLKQLTAMDSNAINAASELARAITFPRQDSYLAAQTLIALGSDISATTLPTLIDNLHHQRLEIRIYSIVVLGTIGNYASCAVGEIAPFLWDSDPYVRSVAASALGSITGKTLILNEYQFSPDLSSLYRSIIPDTPEGKVVGGARKWWTEQGSNINWHPSYSICDP